MADIVEAKLDRILDVVSRMEVRMDHHHERLEKQCATIGEHDARLKASEAQGTKIETLLKAMQEASVDQQARVKVLEADGNRRDGRPLPVDLVIHRHRWTRRHRSGCHGYCHATEMKHSEWFSKDVIFGIIILLTIRGVFIWAIVSGVHDE